MSVSADFAGTDAARADSAGPADAPAALNRVLERLAADLAAGQARFDAARERARAVSATTVSDRRLLSATADSAGRITELKFTGTDYRRMAKAELAKTIADTVNAALDEAARAVRAALAPALPAGLDPERLADGPADPAALFPPGLLPPEVLESLRRPARPATGG
jgi:hypothetical protein